MFLLPFLGRRCACHYEAEDVKAALLCDIIFMAHNLCPSQTT